MYYSVCVHVSGEQLGIATTRETYELVLLLYDVTHVSCCTCDSRSTLGLLPSAIGSGGFLMSGSL